MALLFDSFVFDFLFVFGVLLVGLYIYFTRNFNFWMKNGIPFLKPLPFVGTLKDVVLKKVGMGRYITQLYHDHQSKPYLGIYAFDSPALVVFDLDLIKNILIKDSHVFINRILTVDEEKDPLSYKNIFILKGQRWRHMRTNLTPTFTSGKMKKMFYLVENCAKELELYLDEHTADGKLNLACCVKPNKTDSVFIELEIRYVIYGTIIYYSTS
jgi:cytochrome P450 family 6